MNRQHPENTVRIDFDGEVYIDVERHIFADMLVAYQNRLFDRQKEAKAKLALIPIGDHDNRDCHVQTCFGEYDDSEARLVRVNQIDVKFRNTR